jgi:hypothetical protein
MIASMLFAAAAAAVVGTCAPQPGVTPEQAVDRYMSAYNAHDVRAIQSAYSANVRIHNWQTGAQEGTVFDLQTVFDGLRDYYRDNPRVQVSASGRAVLGARLVQIESYTSGPRALVVYTVVDGCVTARDTYW